MANFNFIGGATKVVQVATGTVTGVWANGNTIRTTLLKEDGTTPQTVTSTATGSNIETNVIDVHVVDLNNSSETLFAETTWAKGSSTTITGTKDSAFAGVPISGGIGVNRPTGSVPSGSGGFSATWADTTTNSGPNDINTNANYTDDEVANNTPTNDEDVKLLPHPTDTDLGGRAVSYDLRYGLNQSGLTNGLRTLRQPRSFRGIIGDPAQGFYYTTDVNPSTGTGIITINSSSPSTWLKGTHDVINIAGLPAGEDALHLHGGTISKLRMLGPQIIGKITIEDNCIVVAIESLGANMEVEIGTQTGTPLSTLIINGGVWRIHRAINQGTGTITLLGGTIHHMVGNIEIVNNYGGTIFFNSTGVIANLNNYAGISNFEQNTSAGITVTNAKIWSGQILDKSGLKNVNWATDIIVYGGTASSDTASTQAQTA